MQLMFCFCFYLYLLYVAAVTWSDAWCVMLPWCCDLLLVPLLLMLIRTAIGGCGQDNGGCAHQCIDGYNGHFHCACNPGFRLAPDGKNCEGTMCQLLHFCTERKVHQLQRHEWELNWDFRDFSQFSLTIPSIEGWAWTPADTFKITPWMFFFSMRQFHLEWPIPCDSRKSDSVC